MSVTGRLAGGTVYSNTMLCFLLVHHAASQDKGPADHYHRQVIHTNPHETTKKRKKEKNQIIPLNYDFRIIKVVVKDINFMQKNNCRNSYKTAEIQTLVRVQFLKLISSNERHSNRLLQFSE